MEKRFEKALRMKYRVKADKGLMSVENLWGLNLSTLNKIAKALNQELKQSEEEDFLEEVSAKDLETKDKFDIVLYILNTKKKEKLDREQAQSKEAEKQKLLALVERKRNEGLENLSEEELLKKINEL